MGKPNGEEPFRRPRRKYEDNIKADLSEMGLVDGTE
jgi:hypothetical protein